MSSPSSSSNVRPLSFRKSEHLRSGADFSRVYGLRCAVRVAHLTVFAAPNPDGRLRVGFSVSKKHGKAGARNRLNRLLREAFRLGRDELPKGLDLVLIPVDARQTTLSEFREALVHAVKKVLRKLPPRADDGLPGAPSGRALAQSTGCEGRAQEDG